MKTNRPYAAREFDLEKACWTGRKMSLFAGSLEAAVEYCVRILNLGAQGWLEGRNTGLIGTVVREKGDLTWLVTVDVPVVEGKAA